MKNEDHMMTRSKGNSLKDKGAAPQARPVITSSYLMNIS
jgi:hypothetical protein